MDTFIQTEVNKEIKLDVEPAEILTKLQKAEQDTTEHPLKLSEESIKNLATCYKQTENFLAKANKFLKRSLLTTREVKRKRYIKKLAIMSSALLVGFVVIATLIHFILSRGYGLSAEYFGDLSLKKLIQTRKDKKIDFDWGLGNIIHNYSDNVSIRWTGKLKAPERGTYRFIINSDDGARLWIDDKLIIDDWKIHPAEDHDAKINLAEGYHQIKVEYLEGEGFASIKLMWVIPGAKSKKVISPSFFRRNE